MSKLITISIEDYPIYRNLFDKAVNGDEGCKEFIAAYLLDAALNCYSMSVENKFIPNYEI